MSELEDFCYICVEKNSSLTNIIESDESNVKFIHKLSLCVPNQVWKEEICICQNCIKNLNLAYNFIQDCVRSEDLRNEKKKLIEQQSEKFYCDKCNRSFSQRRWLLSHNTKIHKKKELQTEITSVLDYVPKDEPKDEHLIVNNEYFGEVNYSSDEESKLNVKKKYNKLKLPLTCEYCGKTFNRRQHYSAHIRAKHTFEKPYKCNLCDAKYTNSHSLLVHKRNHNNEKPFVCSYCGKSFVCSGDLYHHSKIHLNRREYKCNLCDKSFNTASILRTHKICMHLEPKDWKYICRHCDKRFPINSSLVNHMKRHLGVREFSCHICEKKFFDKSELSKHLKSHSNEKFFKCNICESKEYKNSYSLKKHMKIIHDIGTISIVKPEKKFNCPMCSKTFAFNNKLQKHICTHTGVKPFKCHYCDKRFIDNYYRKLHLKKKHNINEITDIDVVK